MSEAATSSGMAMVTGSLVMGGSTTFLCNLAGEWIRRGSPAWVISLTRGHPMASDFQQLNIPVMALDEREAIYEDRMVMALRELGRLRPAVLLSTLSASSFEALRYAPAGVFRVGVGQSDDPNVYAMMGHYAPHMDMLAVVSRTMQVKAEAMPEFARTAVRYLPYGVPLPKRLEARRPTTGPLRILYLGRLSQVQKRVRLFPKILEQLKASGIPFHWTVAGEGEERTFLQENMRSSPQQTVAFAGSVHYREVPKVLLEHDVFLLASDFEGLPLSLLEGMGHGMVPVVSDIKSGVAEVVDASNGILVAVEEVEGYARAIIHLHHHRDELAAKAAAARARALSEFSVEAMTDRWLAAFPKERREIGAWPEKWNIRAPLPERHPLYFSPPMRAIRRLAIRFRKA